MATPETFSEVTGEKLTDLRNTAYKTNTFKYLNYLDYSEFFREHLVPNCPCVFSPEVTKKWKSSQDWVREDGSPNFDYLRSMFGDAVVPVANCKQEQYSSHPKQDWRLGNYLDYWQDYREKGHPPDLECLYLKDWHFTKAFPAYQAYETPVFLQSDWLNEYWDTLPHDDYRFVYMGPKGTWDASICFLVCRTPFHTDVYRSFSWSANICGRKKWIFYPPDPNEILARAKEFLAKHQGCEECLKDRYGNLVYDVTSPDLDDSERYPRATEIRHKVIEVIQEQGEVIFVPSGWHHQVINLEDTISINHNWLNGCNIGICWRHLVDSLEEVKTEIVDCRDMEGWHEQCQLILKVSAGIDFQMFIDLLKVIARHRIQTWQQEGNIPAHTDNSTEACADCTDSSRSDIICCLKADVSNYDEYSVKLQTEPCIDCNNSDNKCGDFNEKGSKTVLCENVKEDQFHNEEQLVSENIQIFSEINDGQETLCICEDAETELLKDSLDTDKVCKCAIYSAQLSISPLSTSNKQLTSREFVFYDLMRIHEVLIRILGNQDVEKLSPDLTIKVKQTLDLVKTCCGKVCS